MAFGQGQRLNAYSHSGNPVSTGRKLLANTSSLSLVRRRAIDLWSRYAIAFF
ncbi:MAG: hypothetical protein F6K56_43940 [Moorea sp. SIO3G5]|nr:hypothetical protein [Moorena sp. SIO3G5]